jgi:hypothetical protein
MNWCVDSLWRGSLALQLCHHRCRFGWSQLAALKCTDLFPVVVVCCYVAAVLLAVQTVWCTNGLTSKAVATYSASVLAPEEQLIKCDEPVSVTPEHAVGTATAPIAV